MATARQIEANRRNAARSTGPRTEEGKARSRANSVKHGLAGAGIVLPPDDDDAVQRRVAEWHSSFKPFDAYEVWLLDIIAVESIRIERCHVLDRLLRQAQVRDACGDSWDLDRLQAAQELASKLGRNPSVASRLCTNIAGASILLSHWKALRRVLGSGEWSEIQEAFALDLLGTPEALREGLASPLHPGESGDLAGHRIRLCDEQIKKMERLISDVLPGRDAESRDRAKKGVSDLEDRALARLHRYESRAHRRMSWAVKGMKSQHRTVTNAADKFKDTPYHRALKPMTLKPEPDYPPTPQTPPTPVFRPPTLAAAAAPRVSGELKRKQAIMRRVSALIGDLPKPSGETPTMAGRGRGQNESG